MPAALTRADSIQFQKSAVEVHHHHASGVIPGLVVLEAAARNGPGRGRLRATGNDGRSVSWQAPGSTVPGVPTRIDADGDYLIEDVDISKYVRVRAFTAFMHKGPAQARVYTDDVYLNPVANDEVTAAEASAGAVEVFTVDIKNVSISSVSHLVVWIDVITPSHEISTDGVTWIAPTSEATGLQVGNLVVGQIFTLQVRRTIIAAAVSNPKVLNWLHTSFYAL